MIKNPHVSTPIYTGYAPLKQEKHRNEAHLFVCERWSSDCLATPTGNTELIAFMFLFLLRGSVTPASASTAWMENRFWMTAIKRRYFLHANTQVRIAGKGRRYEWINRKAKKSEAMRAVCARWDAADGQKNSWSRVVTQARGNRFWRDLSKFSVNISQIWAYSCRLPARYSRAAFVLLLYQRDTYFFLSIWIGNRIIGLSQIITKYVSCRHKITTSVFVMHYS